MSLAGADTGTIYVGNGAAPGRRRMAHIKPIDIDSGRDAMIEFLGKIQQVSEYQTVIEYLKDPKKGNYVPETMERFRAILKAAFSDLGLSPTEIEKYVVHGGAAAMGSESMDEVMRPSPSLGTIAARDLSDDIREDGGNKTMLHNLKVVSLAVQMLQAIFNTS